MTLEAGCEDGGGATGTERASRMDQAGRQTHPEGGEKEHSPAATLIEPVRISLLGKRGVLVRVSDKTSLPVSLSLTKGARRGKKRESEGQDGNGEGSGKRPLSAEG